MPADRSRLRNLGRFSPGFCMFLEGRGKTFRDFCNAPTIASNVAIQKKKKTPKRSQIKNPKDTQTVPLVSEYEYLRYEGLGQVIILICFNRNY